MIEEFVTVARLRAQMADVLARIGRDRGLVYLTQRGEPRAVLLDVNRYRELIDQLEHLDDSVEALLARERRERGEERTRGLSEVVAARRKIPAAGGKKIARGPRARVSR